MNKVLTTSLNAWVDGPFKTQVLDFVRDVCDERHPDFVPVSDRIAVFDNDGTLWVEKPLLTELTFIKDHLQHRAASNESFAHHGLFEKLHQVCEDTAHTLLADAKALSHDLLHGVTQSEYKAAVHRWLDHALHPRFQQPYTRLTYTPMQQLLALFRQHDFQCFIVSGGSTDFIRPWVEPVYSVAQQNVIGSSLRTHLVDKQTHLTLEYLPVPFYFDNGAAKVESIGRLIGKQPIAAFGNSSGDIEMLRYTSQASRSITGLVHHTDAEREYQYSPDSTLHVGASTLALAEKFGWHVLDIKQDWLLVFDFES